MAPTTANPGGLATIPEHWDIGASKNHVILLQIEEWFHSALAGIRQAPGSVGYRDLVIDPRLVGDLTQAEGSYETPYGKAATEWTLDKGVFRLTVEIPANTTAEVRVPTGDGTAHTTPRSAQLVRIDGDRAVYRVPSGTYVFTVRNVRPA